MTDVPENNDQADMNGPLDLREAALLGYYLGAASQAPAEGDAEAAFEAWWYQNVADNSGASIGADYKHWARKAWQAALTAHVQPKGPAEPVGWTSEPIEWSPRQSEQMLKVTRKAQPQYGFVYPLHAAAQSPAPGAALPGDMVLVPRELLMDAAESVEDYRAGVDFGSCDRKLLGRLKAAAGQPKADQQMTDEACQWVNGFFSAKGFYPSLAQCYLAGKAVAQAPAVAQGPLTKTEFARLWREHMGAPRFSDEAWEAKQITERAHGIGVSHVPVQNKENGNG